MLHTKYHLALALFVFMETFLIVKHNDNIERSTRTHQNLARFGEVVYVT